MSHDTSKIDGNTAKYCYLDIDIDGCRAKLAAAAAFVNSTNIRYGLSSDDLLKLGGSEISRLPSLIENDHEWSTKVNELAGGHVAAPPSTGSRIIVELDWDLCPLASENFATLCANGSVVGGNSSNSNKPRPVPIGESGKPLTYRGCPFHRCIPGFCFQGGDFVKHNGSGGECVFANKTKFKDERPGLQQKKHDAFGTLSMGNSGKNSNSSQFFFTLNDDTVESKKLLSKCDGKHVVFGKIVSGGQILREAEKYGSADGTVTKSILISDCGIFSPFSGITPGQGFWYDKPSPESFNGISPTFVVKPRVALLVPHATALSKFEEAATKSGLVIEFSVSLDGGGGGGDQNSSTPMGRSGSAIERISDALFRTYSVDVVVVAPACQKVIDSADGRLRLLDGLNNAKQHWGSINEDFLQDLDRFVLVAKPTDMDYVVRTNSWLHERLQR